MNNELSASQIRQLGHYRPNLHCDTRHSNVISISFQKKKSRGCPEPSFDWGRHSILTHPSLDYPVFKESQVRKPTSRGQWNGCGKQRGEEAGVRGKQWKDHSNFALGPLWQMAKLTGPQLWDRGHGAPRGTVPRALCSPWCPAQIEKHCPPLRGDVRLSNNPGLLF